MWRKVKDGDLNYTLLQVVSILISTLSRLSLWGVLSLTLGQRTDLRVLTVSQVSPGTHLSINRKTEQLSRPGRALTAQSELNPTPENLSQACKLFHHGDMWIGEKGPVIRGTCAAVAAAARMAGDWVVGELTAVSRSPTDAPQPALVSPLFPIAASLSLPVLPVESRLMC